MNRSGVLEVTRQAPACAAWRGPILRGTPDFSRSPRRYRRERPMGVVKRGEDIGYAITAHRGCGQRRNLVAWLGGGPGHPVRQIIGRMRGRDPAGALVFDERGYVADGRRNDR